MPFNNSIDNFSPLLEKILKKIVCYWVIFKEKFILLIQNCNQNLIMLTKFSVLWSYIVCVPGHHWVKLMHESSRIIFPCRQTSCCILPQRRWYLWRPTWGNWMCPAKMQSKKWRYHGVCISYWWVEMGNLVNSLKPKQNGHFADNILKSISFKFLWSFTKGSYLFW